MSAHRIAAQLRMELRLQLRNGENLLVTLGIPVALLLFFSTVDVLGLGHHRVRFLLPGAVAVAVMGAGMVSLAIATGFERSYLVLKRLGATPLRRSELLAAKVAAVALIEVLQVAVLLAAAFAVGWRADLSVAAVAFAVTAVVVGTVAFVGLGLAMAGRLPAMATLALSNALFVVLLLVSGVVFPLERLPTWLAAAAGYTPAAALATVLRSTLAGEAVAAGSLLVLLAWAVLAPAAAVVLFRWGDEA